MNPLDKTFSVEKAEESSGFLLWQVTNLWQRTIKKILTPYWLTHSQFVLLASTHWLTIQGQSVTQITLSIHTKIDPMTTSTVVRSLAEKGFIGRKENPSDIRAKLVFLTAEWEMLIKRVIPIIESFDKGFFSHLGKNTHTFNLNMITLLNSWNLE